MTGLLALEWGGAALGALGALLLACNQPWSRWGWAAFTASNGLLIGFSWATGAYGLLAMMIVMTMTSLLGIWRWIIRPGTRKDQTR